MKSKLFSDEQLEFIKENVKNIGNKELVDLINKKFNTSFTVSQIKGFKHNHKISSGLTGRFKKGHIPANKGTKGKFNVGGNKTSFKKGHIAANNLPIGSERIRKQNYMYVKVQDGHKNKNWKPKHQVIYEEHYGKIPKGSKVIFADGDKTNFDINNLILVTKSELLIMNRKKLIKKSSEATKSGVILAKLIDKRNKIKK